MDGLGEEKRLECACGREQRRLFTSALVATINKPQNLRIQISLRYLVPILVLTHLHARQAKRRKGEISKSTTLGRFKLAGLKQHHDANKNPQRTSTTTTTTTTTPIRREQEERERSRSRRRAVAARHATRRSGRWRLEVASGPRDRERDTHTEQEKSILPLVVRARGEGEYEYHGEYSGYYSLYSYYFLLSGI